MADEDDDTDEQESGESTDALPEGFVPWQSASAQSTQTPSLPEGFVPWQPTAASRTPTQSLPEGFEPWQGDKREPAEPEAEGMLATFARKARDAVLPTLGGISGGALAAGVAAGAGRVLGGAAGGFLGGPGGAVAGWLGGGLAGGYLGEKVYSAGKELLGYDDSIQQAVNAKTNPWSSAAGEVAPLALGLTPTTAAPRIGAKFLESPIGQRLLSGAVSGGAEAGMQVAQGEYDPTRLVTSLAAGAALPGNRGWVRGLEQRGEALAGRIAPHGTPGAQAAAGTAEEQAPPPTDPARQQPGADERYAKEEPTAQPGEEAVAPATPPEAPRVSDPTLDAALQAKLKPEAPETPAVPAAPEPAPEPQVAAPDAIPGPEAQARPLQGEPPPEPETQTAAADRPDEAVRGVPATPEALSAQAKETLARPTEPPEPPPQAQPLPKEPPEVVAPVKGRGPRGRDPETYSLLEYLASRGGLRPSPELQTIFDGNPFIPGFGRLIRKNGKSLDSAWEAATRDASYINDASDRAGREAKTSVPDLLRLIEEEARGNKQYQVGYEGTTTRAQRDRAAESNRVAIERAVDGFVEESGFIEIDQKLHARTIQIMEREGVSDPDIAFERAVMEDADRHEQDARKRKRQDTVGDIPGWDADDVGAAREDGGGLRATGPGPEPGTGAVGAAAGPLPRGAGASGTEERGAEGKPQLVIPGAGRNSDAQLAQRRTDERLRPSAPQRPMDEGIFGDTHLQGDLLAARPSAKPTVGEQLKAKEQARQQAAARPAEMVRGPMAREVAPQHMPWYDRGYTGGERGGNEAEQAAWDRGALDRSNADRAAASPLAGEGAPAKTGPASGEDPNAARSALDAIKRAFSEPDLEATPEPPAKFSIAKDTDTGRHVLFRNGEEVGDFANRGAAEQARTKAIRLERIREAAARANRIAEEPDQAIRRQEIVRGRSGRPIETAPLPIGTEQAILEKGAAKVAAGKAPDEPVPPLRQATARQGPEDGGNAGQPPRPPTQPHGPPPLGGAPRTPNAVAPTPRFPALRRLLRRYQETFQPELISENALKADPQFAKYASARAGERDRIINEGLEREKLWNKTSEPDRIGFMSDVENGRQPTNPVLRPIAQTYNKMLEAAYALEKQWGSKAEYVENYFPHIWERPKPGQAPIQDFFKNSMGPTDFQKARSIDLIEHGLAAGYRLKNSNPEAIIRDRLMAGADMRMQMELLHNLRGMNLATKVVNADAKALSKQGWQTFNAPDREQWILSPDIVPTWRNAVQSKGLWGNPNLAGDAFRSWMGFKAAWVPIKLAASAFHPLHVAHINMSTNLTRAADQAIAGNLDGAYKSLTQAFSLHQPIGTMGRAQWLLGENARTPEGKLAVKTMEEGGFSPMLSEQMRIDAGQKFAEALRTASPFKVAYQGLRLGIQKLQAPIFEHWIPHLKTAAYLNDAAALLERRPELNNDSIARGVALRAIAKSIDNRFGEMFYSGLFWNRAAKDVSIGAFLSLGWNLGFAREFGGAALEAATRTIGPTPTATRQIVRDATNKIKFASIYMGTAALIGGMMTKMLSGDNPSEPADYIFPKVGGINPDGSPRRLSTMFYLREGPMLQKHIEEHGGGIGGALSGTGAMLWNKLMFEPLKELWNNQDYYGREIWDTNAPGYQQFAQAMKHVLTEQTSPMSVTGAQRAQETGGRAIETPLAYMGFGPAPKYAESTALQNRIGHLYRRFVSPEARPYEDEVDTHAKQVARNQLLMAKQRNDPNEIKAATEAARKAGLPSKSIAQLGKLQGDQYMFKRLPQPQQMAILNQATPSERVRYLPQASRKTKQQWHQEHPQALAQ